MWMFQGCAGDAAVVAEEQYVFESAVLDEIAVPVPVGPDDLFRLVQRHVGDRFVVLWALDDDFVGANAIHHVVHSEADAIQVAFYPKGWKFIRNDSNPPARAVRRDFGRTV